MSGQFDVAVDGQWLVRLVSVDAHSALSQQQEHDNDVIAITLKAVQPRYVKSRKKLEFKILKKQDESRKVEGKIRNKTAQIHSGLKFVTLFTFAAVSNFVQTIVAKFATF